MTATVTGTSGAVRLGGPDAVLTEADVTSFVIEQLRNADLDGRSVCLLVPDGTRTCPVSLLLRAAHRALHGRVSRLTVLIALGTHGHGGFRRLLLGSVAEGVIRHANCSVLVAHGEHAGDTGKFKKV